MVDKKKNLIAEEAGVEQETVRIKIHFRLTACRCGVLPVTRFRISYIHDLC
ncbi:MAG: hypothetical protein WAK10_01075 [Methanoregula sp.]